jgi:hypothetical protein
VSAGAPTASDQVEALTGSVSVPAFVPTEVVSSNALPVSLGAPNITLNTQVPLADSVLPMHLLGSSHAKLVPLLSAIDLTSTELVPALIVTFLDATPSASTMPNSTGEGDSVGGSPISVSVICLAVPSPVAELDVPASLPLIDEQPDPVRGIGSDSSQRKLVIVPAPLRSAMIAAGVPASVLPRHVMPRKVQLALIPTTLIVTVDMLGSVPVKLPYCTCHGSVSVRTDIVPALHELDVALVMEPISDLSTFAMLVLWKLPSSVALQLTVTPEKTNLAGAHTTLNVGSLSESCIADAELQATATNAAVRTAASSRRTRLKTNM